MSVSVEGDVFPEKGEAVMEEILGALEKYAPFIVMSV
jgi:hypothetical protein